MNEAADIAMMTQFDKTLLRLRRDVVERCMFMDIDDCRAFLLSGSLLMGNKNLEAMCLFPGTQLTTLGAKALGKAIRKTKIKELILNDNRNGQSEPTSGVRMLYVEAMKSVREIDIAFVLRDTDAQRLGKALRGNKVVEKLSLDLRHVYAPAAVQVLAEGIRLSVLSKLSMYSGPSSVLDKIFEEGIGRSATIKHLVVSSDSGTEALSNILPTLQTLQLNRFTKEHTSLEHLCNGLKDATQLTSLELGSDCPLDDNDMELLSTTLLGNTTLQNLQLDVELGIAGINSLIASWKDGSALQQLELSYSSSNAVGIQNLLKATHTHPHLRALDVFYCHNLDYKDVAAIAKDLHESKLTTFNILLNTDDDSNGEESAEVDKEACEVAGQAVVNAMKSNFYLQQTCLGDVKLLPAARAQIKFYLKLNKSGRRLLMNQGLETSVWCHVLAKRCNDPSLLFYFLREQPALMSSFKNTTSTGSKRRFYTILSGGSGDDWRGRKRRRTGAPDQFMQHPTFPLSVIIVFVLGVLHTMKIFEQTS